MNEFLTNRVEMIFDSYKEFFKNNKPVFEDSTRCNVPPEGWLCSRKEGHEGSCAAWPKEQ